MIKTIAINIIIFVGLMVVGLQFFKGGDKVPELKKQYSWSFNGLDKKDGARHSFWVQKKGQEKRYIFDYTSVYKTVNGIWLRHDRLPEFDIKDPKTQIVLLGGSFVAGDGVEDRFTLRNQLISEFRNRGHDKIAVEVVAKGGDSLANIYESFLNNKKTLPFVQKGIKTIFVYFFNDAHFPRFSLSYYFYSSFPHTIDFPFFEMVDGKLSYRGSFADNFPIKRRMVDLLKITGIVDGSFYRKYEFRTRSSLIGNFAPDLTIEDYGILIDEFASQLEQVYEKSHFIVVGSPSHAKNLSETGIHIPIWEFSIPEEAEGFWIEKDGHPTGKQNRWLAGELAKPLLKALDAAQH